MHKFAIIGSTLALAVTWSFGPALAQTTTTDKMEKKAERAADKAERAADKAERSAEKAADKVEDKADATKDTMKDKAVRAKDKVKDKFTHAKDKMRSKTDGRMSMNDTRAAQEALKTQGMDPGPIDGRMGPRTRAAVSDYQRKNDLPVTGMLDDATMSKLNVRSSRTSDVPAASPTTQPDPKKQTQ